MSTWAAAATSAFVVFDNDLNYKTEFNHVGAPWGMCITSGPHQYLYASNANPDSQQTPLHEVTGQIYKMELDGTVLGKFGVPGKEPGQFGTAHTIDCRNENVIFDRRNRHLARAETHPAPHRQSRRQEMTYSRLAATLLSHLALRRLAIRPAARNHVRVPPVIF